jgi:hypothetical protein
MKLEDGDNKFLILGSAILGYEYWNLEGKPVRMKERPTQMPIDIKEDQGGKKNIRHFWAFPVWNFKAKEVSILEITQKQIMGALQTYARNEDWGDPILTYTITINRKGSGFDTEYNVIANPVKDLAPEITESWAEVQAKGFDLTALYKGGDPFTPTN